MSQCCNGCAMWDGTRKTNSFSVTQAQSNGATTPNASPFLSLTCGSSAWIGPGRMTPSLAGLTGGSPPRM
eukprot:1801359-Rhodomonas_salina.1